jgi:hypothetical protein
MRPIAIISIAGLCLVAPSAWSAESQKLEAATVVVQGKVRKVFREEGENDDPLVKYLFEMVVEKVDKAAADNPLKPGKILLVSTHRVREVPMKLAPAIILPYVKPAKGDTVKVYCHRLEDGAYGALMNAGAIKVIERAKER